MSEACWWKNYNQSHLPKLNTESVRLSHQPNQIGPHCSCWGMILNILSGICLANKQKWKLLPLGVQIISSSRLNDSSVHPIAVSKMQPTLNLAWKCIVCARIFFLLISNYYRPISDCRYIVWVLSEKLHWHRIKWIKIDPYIGIPNTLFWLHHSIYTSILAFIAGFHFSNEPINVYSFGSIQPHNFSKCFPFSLLSIQARCDCWNSMNEA